MINCLAVFQCFGEITEGWKMEGSESVICLALSSCGDNQKQQEAEQQREKGDYTETGRTARFYKEKIILQKFSASILSTKNRFGSIILFVFIHNN